jgi:Family of unknown function (DUF6069)
MSAASDPSARPEPAPGEAAAQLKHRYPDGRPDLGRLVGWGILGVGLAIFANLILARLATGLLDPPATFVPLRGANVVFLTLVASALGVCAFLMLVLTTRRPARWFRVAAYTVALLSCLSPASLLIGEPPRLAGTSVALVLALLPLHLVPAVILAELFARRAWPEG